ncbi:NAD(P)-dependent glycerol-3-phosphate dehydrogenase [Cereibacter sphaeroides]|uniref:NAD(P)H-dependent glycerol-3-phosphate dehydrogenase n=1 Tax=Cereibacter sphaeroides TaxID=1063 RepID=UPI001F1A6957|nr:NAD(P)H-dependent glycerol-3-phosphate dehydrogenase [Cereibacter sphaeroides]MCE6960047.1 NAD(P)-dependent glycerol-3-phosphate dehydrogenase [Cereibacter sphaeroides]MCE6968590.1 NAD(P)-dependent glycerol-3-phosphate dehydrogenase [Cereibacter sphaeroides]MCE6973132.1 NAD(P)-dependent glycerol-3-phosphate dehydrogenase [Cereibacter sphaeroides]
MIGILGAGAFGTALAVTLGREQPVMLWGRRGVPKLDVPLPDNVTVTADLGAVEAETVLLAVPMQALGGLLREDAGRLDGRALVACCKGVDLATGLGPTALIRAACPRATAAVLTGPSFAADIARGLPTALTLACADDAAGEALQRDLSTAALRLYRTTDVTGAELGGALKNVIAIAAGVVIGAGLGHSARAALMTRGYAEMQRIALALGARAETLAGLSGFGDLVLTCTSDQSRNFRFGQALGAGAGFDATVTVEGRATATAVTRLSAERGIDMPIAAMVDALAGGRVTLPEAIQTLLSRPLKQE